jgi:uracil-DNA glycosylase family 4
MPRGFANLTSLPVLIPQTQYREPQCGSCGLYKTCKSPKMPVGGRGRKKILVVGESPGAEEDNRNTQFVGPTGQYLRSSLSDVGIDLELDCWKYNAAQCFVSPKVRIYTPEGYKWIRDIKVGDLVLTHKGRFKKVLSRSMDMPEGLRINRLCVVDIKVGRIKLTVTADHLFMVSGKWKRADEISVNDKIRVLGEKCVVCGGAYHKNPGRYDSAESTCSPKCHNVLVGSKNGSAVSKSLKGQYKSGIRDRYEITTAANKEFRRLIKNGEWNPTPRTKEEKKVIYRKIAVDRQRWDGFFEHVIVGKGEREVADYLLSSGVRYCHQYAIGRRNFDFYIPRLRLLIEVENPDSFLPNKRIKLLRHAARTKIAERTKKKLVFLRSSDPKGELKRLLKNDSHEYVFLDVPVIGTKIRKPTKRHKIYCLEVEEDHSYVSVGIVSHNCRPPNNDINYQSKVVEYCRPNVVQAIERLRPEKIILVGSSAVESVLGSMWRDDHGKVGGVSRWRGFQIPCRKPNAWVCATYHPSAVTRSKDRGGNPVVEVLFKRDLAAAAELKGRPWDNIVDLESQVEPIMDVEKATRRIRKMHAAGRAFCFDYETNMLKPDSPRSRIISCGLCRDGEETIAFPWAGPVKEAMKRLLVDKTKPKVGANRKFEWRWTLAQLGVEVEWGSDENDTVLMAHLLDNSESTKGARAIASVKFQAFALLGIKDWSTRVHPYLKTGDKSSGYDENQIHKVDLRTLLVYNGMDALVEYLLIREQHRRWKQRMKSGGCVGDSRTTKSRQGRD